MDYQAAGSAMRSDAVCIGCGRTDSRACVNRRTKVPCHWLRLDRALRCGVCSECGEHVARWDNGNREPVKG